MGERQVCAVCGQGGYWVGYSAPHGEDRCINHLHDETPDREDGSTSWDCPRCGNDPEDCYCEDTTDRENGSER